MSPSSINTDELKKLFSDYLKAKNLRCTTERNAIFAKVCMTNEPFALDTIWQQLEDENFHVSRASVYNTMELLLDANIIVRHQFACSIIKYELKCISDGHIYLICNECGTVRKVRDEKLTKYFTGYKIPKFTTEYYSLYFNGICSKCKYRLANKELKRKKIKQ